MADKLPSPWETVTDPSVNASDGGSTGSVPAGHAPIPSSAPISLFSDIPSGIPLFGPVPWDFFGPRVRNPDTSPAHHSHGDDATSSSEAGVGRELHDLSKQRRRIRQQLKQLDRVEDEIEVELHGTATVNFGQQQQQQRERPLSSPHQHPEKEATRPATDLKSNPAVLEAKERDLYSELDAINQQRTELKWKLDAMGRDYHKLRDSYTKEMLRDSVLDAMCENDRLKEEIRELPRLAAASTATAEGLDGLNPYVAAAYFAEAVSRTVRDGAGVYGLAAAANADKSPDDLRRSLVVAGMAFGRVLSQLRSSRSRKAFLFRVAGCLIASGHRIPT